jgi:hypothetical protein
VARFSGRRLLALAVAGIVLSSCHLVTLSPCHGEDLPDPLPIRRVQLRPGTEPAGADGLKILSREQFEELVRRAARGAEAARKPPRLVEAHYSARLAEDVLDGSGQPKVVNPNALTGNGEWRVLNPGAGAAVLPLGDLNLALRQPTFENRQALVGELNGKSLGLLVDQPGAQAVMFGWSVRGEHRPEGLVFALETPACPVASLELDLPADWSVTVASDGCLLSGPDDVAGHRLWKVGFPGRSQVRLVLRRIEAERQPLVLAGLESEQKLAPGALEATFTFDVQILHGSVTELHTALDPSLRPYRVAFGKPSDKELPALETWQLQKGPDGAAVVAVRLPGPVESGRLQVQALAPLGGDGKPVPWSSPWARLEGAVPRGETLKLSLDPDVQLEDWRPGGFRLTQSKPEGGARVLTLTGGALPQRPGGRVQVHGVDFRARPLLWWQPTGGGAGAATVPGRPALTARITYEVSRGRLFQLRVALPHGWDVDRLGLNGVELRAGWGVRQENGRPVLTVDLLRPLTPGSAERGAVLTVWLRAAAQQPPPQKGVPAALTYPFPEVVPLGATTGEGALAISYDQGLYDAQVRTAAVAAPPDQEGPEPWGRQTVAYFYPYRGQPVSGSLVLQPRRTRVRARCSSAVLLTADRVAVLTQLTLQPDVGNPDSIDLYVSAPVAGRWEWKAGGDGDTVRSFERLPAAEAVPLLASLAARHPLAAAGLLAAVTPGQAAWRGERWRLTLARPLREPLTLEGSCEVRRGGERPDDIHVEVPLLAVLGSGPMEGEVKLYVAGANLLQVEAVGLRELQAPVGARGNSPSPWRAFRYGQAPVALALRGQAAADRAPRPVIDRAELTTCAATDGRVLYRYRFQVWSWQQGTLPLRLPAGARALSARVDGRWIGRLAPLADPAAADAGGVELPVPGARALHRYEVVYALDGPAWSLGARLESPEPGLPLELKPMEYRRTWLLAPGLVPLEMDGWRQLPGPAPDTLQAWVQDSAAAWERLAGRLALGRGDDWRRAQRRRLEDAAAGLGKAEEGKMPSLGEALDRLVFEQLRDQEMLVLDAWALREAGLGPATPLPAPEGATPAPGLFWERLGLVHVPCPAAPLLTTRRQLDAWETAGGPGGPLAPSVREAVAEAVAHGHDQSGRFRVLADWLEGTPPGPPGTPPLLAQAIGPDWTEWEPLPGAPDPATLHVVRRDAFPTLGLALAVLLVLVAWRARRRSPRWRLLGLLAWLAIAGLGVLWLPQAVRPLAGVPLASGTLVALAWYLRSIWPEPARPAAPGSSNKALGAGAASVIALLVLGLLTARCLLPAGSAAGPDAATVYLVPGPPDAPDTGSVLAPRDLLEQLEALARRAAGPRDPVLVSADYTGDVKNGDDVARFEARFTAHSFGDEPAALLLPLAGVQLEDDVLVDGKKVTPALVPGPAAGYRLKVEGPAGPHVLTAHFRVLVRATGEDRDLQFTAPRLAQSRLVLTVPDGARYLHALARQGKATLDAQGTRLEVELGRVSAPVQFRWRQEATPPRAPVVRVEELYLWELSAAASNLSAVLRCTVASGALTRLELDLPEPLDVRGVEAGPPGSGKPEPRLQDWRVTAGPPRRLQLDFQAPVTAGVQVVLDLVPRRPLASREVLPLPAPVDAEATGGALAYRLDGIKGDLKTFLRVNPIEPEQFVRRWRAARGSAPAASPAYACTFERRPAGPALGLDLEVEPPHFEAVQDLAWRAGLRQVDLRAVLRLTPSPDGAPALVEWDVPETVTLTRLSGPDVASWSRTGTRIQVWLTHALGAGDSGIELQATGWWLPPGGRAAGDGFTLDLPRLGFPAAQSQMTYVRLTASGGRAVNRVALHKLYAFPDSHPAAAPDAERAYLSPHADYGGTFRVAPAAARAAVRVLTVAEVRDRALAFTATLDCRVPQGELHALTVRLRNWDGDQVGLREAPAVAGVRADRRQFPGRDAADHTWEVELHPGVADCRLTLTGSMALEDAAGGVPMPEVSMDGAATTERWLALAGTDLRAEDVRGLTAVTDVALARAAWPEEARRVQPGGAWRAAAGAWGLRMVPRTRAATAPVQVFVTEQAVALADGRHWVHAATWWLFHEASTDLNVTLPPGATVLAAAVDGVEVTPWQPEPGAGSLWLPLPGGTGARCVQLRWQFPGEGTALDRPNLEQPRLEGVAGGPAVWTVQVPAGYTAAPLPGSGEAPGSEAARPASRGALELRRAEAQLRLSEALARQGQGRGEAFAAQLAAAQRRFYQFSHQAEHWLAPAAEPVTDAGPEGQSLSDWRQQLEERNNELVKDFPGVAAVQAEARRQSRAGAVLPAPVPGGAEEGMTPAYAGLAAGRPAGDLGEGFAERGTPLYWQTADAGAAAPELRLTAVRAQQLKRALAASLLLGALLLGTWLLSYVPGIVPWLRALWPEQVALLGGLGWLTTGLNLLVIFVLVLGVCGRLVLLSRWVLALRHRPPPAAARSPSAGGAAS